MTNSPIVGREAELSAISAALLRMRSGPGALVLQGSAGIGKTTLWQSGVAEARAGGQTVLVTRAAESEARMSYAALGDLLAGLPEATFATLPAPLRRALDRALLRGDGAAGSPDPRAVSLAVAQAIHALAAAQPVVVAIDDVQWLDRPSARVLSFVFRRLTDEPVGVLESLRLGSGAPADPIETDRAFAECEHLTVGPLTVGALGRLLRQRTNPSLPRPFVVRLHEITDGNPLFALEIARTTRDPVTAIAPGERWPVPGDLQRVLSARLARLPPATQRPLLAIAASSQPTWELVLRVVGSSERSRSALARAEEAGIIERIADRVRFSHPLLASTVYANATETERRALHLRLASAAADLEERARHLALGTGAPSADVAEVLETAARGARARGAPDAAADLAELSTAMTPPADEAGRRRRRLVAAEYHFDAGDASRAHRVLREIIEASPPGIERAEMLYRLASMSWMNLLEGVRSPAEQALAEAGEDAPMRCAIHNALCWVAFYRADLPAAGRHARESLRWSEVADPAARADALATLAFVEFLEGRPNPGLMAQARALQDVSMEGASWTEGSVYTTPGSIHALELMWSGRLAEARDVLERELAAYEQHAMYALRQEVLCYLSELECRAGRFELAAGHGRESMDIIQESGQAATQRHVVLFNEAWPAALLGRVEEAREMATTGVRLAEANDDPFNGSWNHAVLGFLELSLAAYEPALVHLEAAATWVDALGSVELAVIPCLPDLVETLVALGRIDDARPVVERLAASAAGRDRPWAAGTAARGRAMIAAAGGDLSGAAATAERSIAELDRASQPFEAARSRLVLGQIHRRAKQKRLAREALERARDAFAELGARVWEARAEAELRRIGGRTPSPFELTETEASIASLVARGLSNREAADALFLSPATVQASLKRIYQKLGVRSRTELAATLARPTGD